MAGAAGRLRGPAHWAMAARREGATVAGESEQQHRLAGLDATPDGHRATCFCGWVSEPHPRARGAGAEWDEHVDGER